MSRKMIRDAFEKRLVTLTPSWLTAWDNVAFDPEEDVPSVDQGWQRANCLFSEVKPAGRGVDAGEIHEGVFQVTVFSRDGVGPQVAESRASLIIGDRGQGITGQFYRGQTLVEGGVTVTVLQPYAGPPIDDDPKWYGLPLLIPFVAYVF